MLYSKLHGGSIVSIQLGTHQGAPDMYSLAKGPGPQEC